MPSDANLQLHHIGVLVKDLAKAAETYEGRFGYLRMSEIIHDPVQTAMVQFLQLQGDRAYTELITPDGPNSKLINALNKGEGLHHLCYSTDNIDETCARLRHERMTLIAKPVSAVAFDGRRVAWLRGTDRLLIELVERALDNGC
jgi:methylmalonyl-CoA/ethylmalonyl-CoA epimerase